MRKLFGTDGIRGKIGEYPMLPDVVVKIGFVAGEVVMAEFRKKNPTGKPRIIIGKDPRLSGYMVESALEAGFSAAGVDVLLTGPLPTPGVAYLTKALRLQAGLVISASHNPYFDNGIKFFSAEGLKLSDALEKKIEAHINDPINMVSTEQVGRAKRIDDAQGRYIEFCKSRFPADLNLRGLHLVVDCANGAGYKTIPLVLHELGARLTIIGNTPDGLNINKEVGATHPETLRKAVLEHQADLGVALDGDGDRLALCDAKGNILDGDDVLFILSQNLLKQPKVKNPQGIVGTVMTNAGLERHFQQVGIPFERVQVGDRHILARLMELGWNLGGETSGHILMLDHHCSGDGTLSALQVLARMVREKRALHELTEGWTRMPQSLVNVRLIKGFQWQDDETIKKHIAQAEKKLAHSSSGGRLLIRASGTEPLIRILVEAGDAAQLVIAKELAELIAKQMQ